MRAKLEEDCSGDHNEDNSEDNSEVVGEQEDIVLRINSTTFRLYESQFSLLIFFSFLLRRQKMVVRYIELAEARSYTLLWMENPLRVFSLVF